ncbi:hypothetical protein, partial [uncultured Campylobacter sp.]|uniref:hypothetical protein n=1 Tax=uncultured Campylobacter sp. TaxID=218934 RepID=UPI00262D83B7
KKPRSHPRKSPFCLSRRDTSASCGAWTYKFKNLKFATGTEILKFHRFKSNKFQNFTDADRLNFKNSGARKSNKFQNFAA